MKKLFNKIKNNKLLFFILMIGLILRFFHIDFQSVWIDEIHTLNEANPNLSLIEVYNKVIEGEQMPPLYFYTVYFLFKIFGYTPFVMRAYSSVLGVLSLYSIYKLGKEMHSKNVGIIASLLLCVNYFHIVYSQEGRPYSFFVLFTILSFYWLIKLIKLPTYKTGIYYAIFTTLMLYGHFFGLFTLFSQYIIVLVFLIFSVKSQRIDLIKVTAFSSILMLILYSPALARLFSISKITEFWIPKPTSDSLTLIYKEFFGNSEIILALLVIPILAYLINIYNNNQEQSPNKNEIVNDKTTMNFLVLSIWISIVILCPLIRSYISIPMLLSRYFITILPAILLLIAIGINSIKNVVVVYVLCSMFFIFSINDILVIKNFYNTVYKSEFREITNFVKEKNKTNRPVVSSLGVYMPYFFEKNKTEIIGKNLDEYIAEMQSDTTKIREFWYIDGHGRDYTKNEKTLSFINKNFAIEDNFDGVSAWTKHFVSLKNYSSKVDLTKYKKINDTNGDVFKSNIEFFENNGITLKVTGWAFYENQGSITTKVDVILINLKTMNATKLRSQKVFRPDITTYFKSKFDLESAGFSGEINLNDIDSGNYRLALMLVDGTTKKEGIVLTDKEVIINNK